MQVMCISEIIGQRHETAVIEKRPDVGDICTVTNGWLFKGYYYYELEGYENAYNSKFFSPLSDVSETEIHAEYIKKLTPCAE